MRVLIAEDDKIVSTLLAEVVRQGGHTPVPAFDAMQTLMYAMRAPQPDLVLLDLSMPAGSGIDALRRLKGSAKTAHIPVVVVSGSTDAAAREEVARLGAAEFIEKPIVPERVAEAIARAGGGAR